jgi:hypothetical protein
MIRPNLQFTVIVSGMATVLNSSTITGPNFNTTASGEKLRFNNMRFGVLPAKTTFSIRKWSVMGRVSNRFAAPVIGLTAK